MNFSENLKLVQVIRGISTKKLAKEMGVSVAHISAYRNGHAPSPSLRTITKFAKALKVRPSMLISDSLADSVKTLVDSE
jgi:transcriptional regulator with XRE-family HTH domain